MRPDSDRDPDGRHVAGLGDQLGTDEQAVQRLPLMSGLPKNIRGGAANRQGSRLSSHRASVAGIGALWEAGWQANGQVQLMIFASSGSARIPGTCPSSSPTS